MSVILVVERDASRAERISEALRRDGLSVTSVASRAEAVHSAEERVPRLLLASSVVPEVSALLAGFSRRSDGPGTVVIVDDSGSSAADYHADELLTEPFSDDELRQLVQRCLNPSTDRPEGAASDAAAPGGSEAEQMTSADIFGDVLAEVEAEARGARPVTPEKPSRPMGDIERRLEETLSGVIPLAGKSRRPNVTRAPEPHGTGSKSRPEAEAEAEAEIDDLLDQTLSSLDISTRLKRPPTPAAPAGDRPEAPLPPSHQSKTGEALPSPRREEAGDAVFTPPPETVAPAKGTEPRELANPEAEATGSAFGVTAPEPTPDATAPELTPAVAAPEPDPGQMTSLEELQPEASQFRTQPLSISDFAVDFAADVSERRATTGSSGDIAPPLPAADDASELASESGPSELASGSGPSELPSGSGPSELPSGTGTSELPSGTGTSELPSGETFGDYTLLDRIAVGGMAEVWRARRPGVEGFQKIVAIKKILSHLTGSQDFITMFIDEAKLAAQLSHNNIIQIYDLGKVGDDFFIAMEHVDGKDLRSILTAAQESNRPIPLGLSLLIISAVARALDYAHRKRDFDNRAMGLVHRDVSPQNVMISYEGAIKLCDFGIVKAVAKASTTQMGALKGKLQYMSPEQAWGKSVDARSDIFSLGSVFYEVLTGSQLFSGESEISVLDAVRECRIGSPREIVPEIPEDVARIVGKALAKSPDERFQKAGDLEHEIRAVLDNLRPTSNQKDLADYLHTLFDMPKSGVVALATPGGEAQAPSAPATPQAESFIAEHPAVAEPVTEIPTAEAPVAPEPAAETPPRPGRWKWLAAAVLVAMLAGIGFFAWTSLRQGDTTIPVAAPPPSRVEATASPPTPAVSPAPLEDAAAASADDPTGETDTTDRVEVAGDAEPPSDPAATTASTTVATDEEPAEPGPAVTAAGIDIEQMVNEELTSRAEQLRRDFEAEKKRIEEELARTQKETPKSAKDDEEDTDGEGNR